MIRLRLARWAALGLMAWGAALGAAGLEAVRTLGPIRLDGGMREPDWDRAPAATGFRTSWPDFGRDAVTPTEVKVLYDDQFLYVGARMGLPRGVRPVRRLHRRDQESTSDWFGVYIDSNRDRRTAFGFLVNAAGVQRDALYAGDAIAGDSSWDAVWESQVKAGPGGWTAVLKIPLSVLRLRSGGNEVWGINFSRTDSGAIRESSYWDLPPRGENAFASRFPDLTGIKGVAPQLRREWIPFFTYTDKFRTANVYDDRRRKVNAGLDAHLGLTSASQLDLTLRPDFAQVEVDQAVLNLSTVETVFPEKRPFFLEGMEIFQFPGVRLFYSRRIGRSLASPTLDDGQTLLDGPATAEIAAAAKYTAKLDTGLSVGALAAGVENARGIVDTGDGGRLGRNISPYATYGVLRALQTVDGRGSTIGILIHKRTIFCIISLDGKFKICFQNSFYFFFNICLQNV
ncbi:MAG: carbohydrate binding family 9 domain-containing protein [Holophaga sp.]|nr:carbohydrate binding family 9 domain-containing protein [Holophaga sp.]